MFYFILSASMALLAVTAVAEGWSIYETKVYGFSMLIPAGTPVKEREWGGGWGGPSARHEGVKLFGLAKLAARATDDEIERFAVQTIGIPASEWTKVDQGGTPTVGAAIAPSRQPRVRSSCSAAMVLGRGAPN